MWRELNGVRRWFTQLVCERQPYQKPKNYVADGLVGLDLNISNIAFVSDSYAGLLPFAEGVPSYQRQIAAFQRQMERSRHINNPDNFEPNFESKRGPSGSPVAYGGRPSFSTGLTASASKRYSLMRVYPVLISDTVMTARR